MKFLHIVFAVFHLARPLLNGERPDTISFCYPDLPQASQPVRFDDQEEDDQSRR
jgi:hypothetical protein